MNESANYSMNPPNIFQDLSPSEAIAWCVAFGTEALAVVIFNLLTIAIFVTNRRLRRRKFYILLNLAFADLLVGAVAIPFFIHILGGFFGLWASKLSTDSYMAVTHADIFSGFSSIISLAVVSMERVYATFWPFRYRVLQKKVYVILIAFIWVLSTLPPSVQAITGNGILSVKQQAYIWVPFTIVLFLIMCVSYSSILIKVRGGKQWHGSAERNRKLTLSLLLLTMVSLVTWMPFAILHALISLDVSSPCDVNTYYLLKLLHYSNSLMNPIIYAFRIPNIKKEAMKLVRRRSIKQLRPRLPLPSRLDSRLPTTSRGTKCNSKFQNTNNGVCILLKYHVNAVSSPSTNQLGFPVPFQT